jgi:LysR family pca operon transcriptional activator
MELARYLDQRLKLRHFRLISAISQHASLLNAANALRLTQPALSRSLQEIEDILGVKLYDRHSKGVRETRYGAALNETAKAILAEIAKLDATLDRLTQDSSIMVTVGALPVAAMGVMPGVIARLHDEQDDLRVRLVQGTTDDLLPALMSGQLDLIVGRLYETPMPDGLVRETLYYEPIWLMARPDNPIFQPPGPTLERLAECKLALPSVATLLGQEIDELLTQMGIELSKPIRSSSLGFIREMMQSSEVVSIMPRLMLAGDLMRGTIRVAPLPVPSARRPAGITYRRDAPLAPSAQRLIRTLKGYIAEALGDQPVEA